MTPQDVFVVDRAKHHGEMAVYFVQRLMDYSDDDPEICAFNDVYHLRSAVIEAREAAHWARSLGQRAVAEALAAYVDPAKSYTIHSINWRTA